MNQQFPALAFAAGLVAALNPCGFAMLPAYLALVVGDGGPRAAAALRAVIASVAMTLGFLAVFAVFGTLTVSVASSVQRYAPIATVIVGVALIAVGSWLLAGRRLGVPVPAAISDGRWAPGVRLWSMFGYGAAYAVASLSCTVGPFLAVTAARTAGSIGDAVAVYLAYAAGFGLIVTTLAVAAAFAGTTVTARLRRLVPLINRLGGVLVIIVGIYVAYYGYYELRLFSGSGSAQDSAVATAGRLQGELAGWVHSHGGWPWLVTLVLLLGATGIGFAVRRHPRG